MRYLGFKLWVRFGNKKVNENGDKIRKFSFITFHLLHFIGSLCPSVYLHFELKFN